MFTCLFTILNLPFKILFCIILSKYFLYFLFTYALISFIIMKYLMRASIKYREIKKEELLIHNKYKMFRRLDTTHWNETKFLLGAILFSWLKLTGVIFGILFCYFSLKILLFGKNIKISETNILKNSVLRRKIELICKISGWIVITSFGIIIKETKLDYDYTPYLGKDYICSDDINPVNQVNQIKPATYIVNHTSWLDIVVLVAKIQSGFISRVEVEFYPMIGFIAKCLGCIFVDRNNKENRGNVLNCVIEKQKQITTNDDTSKFVIFPEGTTSNNTGIMPFKQGAFLASLPLKPYIIKFDPKNKLSLAMDVIEMLLHIFIILCTPIHDLELISLPIFIPNNYLYTKSKLALEGEGIKKENWLIYAETMREIMCEVSGLQKIEGNYEMKKDYLSFLRKK